MESYLFRFMIAMGINGNFSWATLVIPNNNRNAGKNEGKRMND